MKEIILLLLSCSLSGALAISLILLLKKLLQDKLSAVWHCYVWIVVMALLLIPMPMKLQLPNIPQTPTASVENHPAEIIPSEITGLVPSPAPSILMPQKPVPQEIAPPKAEEKQPISLSFPEWGWTALAAIWFAGMVSFFGKRIIAYRRFVKRLKCYAYEAEEQEVVLLRQVEDQLLMMSDPVQLMRCDLPITPMIIGWKKPTLFLPREELTKEQLKLIFTHELCHYHYGDLLYKTVAMILQGIHWFNPLCKWMVEDIDFSCEFCCDRRVTEKIGAERGKEYSALILYLLRSSMSLTPSASFSMDKTSLKRRLSLIMKPKKTSRMLMTALTVLLVLCGAACSAVMRPEATVPAEKEESKIEETVSDTIPTPGGTAMGWGSLEHYLNEVQDERIDQWLASCPQDEDTAYVLKMRKTQQGVTSTRFLIYYPWADKAADYDFEGGRSFLNNTFHLTIGKLEEPNQDQLLYLLHHDDSDADKKIEITCNGEKLNCIVTEADFYAERKNNAVKNSDGLTEDQAKNSDDAALDTSIDEAVVQNALTLSMPIPLHEERSNAKITAEFGSNGHKGLDITANSGSAIYAAADGVVRYADWMKSYGFMLIIDHGNNIRTLYGHCDELTVSVGDKVTSGETVIAKVGSTGLSTGVHLHFELQINGEAVDPAPYLPELAENPTDLRLNCPLAEGWGAMLSLEEAASLHQGDKNLFEAGVHFNIEPGTAILAANDGVVQDVRSSESYGEYVRVVHNDGLSTLYAHCSAIHVTEGQLISTGQHIADSGSSGDTTEPVLYFEVHYNEAYTIPQTAMPKLKWELQQYRGISYGDFRKNGGAEAEALHGNLYQAAVPGGGYALTFAAENGALNGTDSLARIEGKVNTLFNAMTESLSLENFLKYMLSDVLTCNVEVGAGTAYYIGADQPYAVIKCADGVELHIVLTKDYVVEPMAEVWLMFQ